MPETPQPKAPNTGILTTSNMMLEDSFKYMKSNAPEDPDVPIEANTLDPKPYTRRSST